MTKMNLPNKLTMFRLCLVPVITVFLLLPTKLIPWQIAYPVGLLLFICASLTDMLDGKIARARGLITNFGKFMDPVADKFMVIGTMMALLFRMQNPDLYGVAYPRFFGIVFFAAVLLVIFRELAITSLRLVLVNASGKVVAANMLGKIKTVCQIVSVCTLFIEPLLYALIGRFVDDLPLARVYPLSVFTVALMLLFTVWSGANYIKGGWKFISTDW